MTTRELHVIAQEITRSWKKPSIHALPYLGAMREMSTIDQNYYLDDGKSIVLYFLSNASSWRGDDARRIKKELKSLL